MSKESINQLDLNFEPNNCLSTFNIFHPEDLVIIDQLTVPKIIRFFRADKFDSKYIISTNDIWKFTYSGRQNVLDFNVLDLYEKKLAKFLLVNFIQVNTPSSLDKHFNCFLRIINFLNSNKLKLEYKNLKDLLIGLINNRNNYYFLKYVIKNLFLENFF